VGHSRLVQTEQAHPRRFARLRTALALVHPLAFAAAIVLDRFALTNTSGHELLRPVLAALAVAGGLVLLLLLVLRNPAWAGLLASIIVLGVMLQVVFAAVIVAVAVWGLLIGSLRGWQATRRLGLTVDAPPVGLATLLSLGFLAVSIWSAGWALAPRLDTRLTLPPSERSQTNDIILLLLDGHPRSDTLSEEFGYDSSSFEDDLAALGFEVADEARANYTKTWLTMASMLNGQYVQDIDEFAEPPSDAPGQARLAEELINAGAVTQRLRDHGYEIVSIPSTVPTTDVTTNVTIRRGLHLTSFEIALISASAPSWIMPRQVLDVLTNDMAASARSGLSAIATAAGQDDGPQLVLAHLMQPHPPFVLGQEADYLAECFPRCKVWETTVEETEMSEQAYVAAMRTQVATLHELVVDALSRIVDDNPDATVILMSDHGARHHLNNVEEHFNILFAARPGGLDVSFPEDITPVNVFRRVLAAQDPSADLADLPYEAWVSDWTYPLNVTPYR
jgi:hypothetical protein